MEQLEITEFLQSYLPNKFTDYKISGHNFMVHSIFCDDYKHKLGIDLRTGQYHCFKSGESGSFVKLYSILENMPLNKAYISLNYKIFLKEHTKTPDYRNLIRNYYSEEQLENAIAVGPNSYSTKNELIELAWYYLMDRKLFDLANEGNNIFFVCESGFYRNRLIIPYVASGKIIYFQARALKPDMKPKYLCAQEGRTIVRGADVLYPFDLKEDYVVICEGPIDARSLQLQGVNATCTTGVSVSEVQMDALRWFGKKIIFGYDNDKAGEGGLKRADKMRKKKIMPELFYCFPPSQFKDWNEAHQEDFDLKSYVEQNTKPYNFENLMTSSLANL